MDSLEENPSDVRNIRAYLITTIYNAPITISQYYRSRVNHDRYNGRGLERRDDLQEQVNEKTIALQISTVKLTARVLRSIMAAYLRQRKEEEAWKIC